MVKLGQASSDLVLVALTETKGGYTDAAAHVLPSADLVIVEDNAGDLAIAQHYLRAVPEVRRIATFGHCADAVAYLQNHPTGVILLDLGLPDSSGLPTLQAIREASPNSAVIVLTGGEDEQLALQVIRLGAQDFINKDTMRACNLSRSLREAIERKNHELCLERVSRTDVLTGLANCGLFSGQVAQSVARSRRKGENFAVMYIDLDGFKPVNDQAGHQAGDAALVEVAARLRAQVRESDTVARLGGDEFGILLEGIDKREALASLAERMIASLRQPVATDAGFVTVGASVGIAVFPASGDCVEDLLKAADAAMYAAKRAGGSTFRFDAPSPLFIGSSADLHVRLQTALKREHFQLYFQQQVDLVTGNIEGFESFLRWHDETGEVHGPASFLPALQGTQLGHDVTDWVLWQAIRTLRTWQDEGRSLVSLAINVSLDDLGDVQGFAAAGEAARSYSINPRRIEIEVSASEAQSDLERTKRAFTKLRAMGFKVVLSNFGDACSSLILLSELTPDVVKVDRACVARLGFDGTGRSLAAAIAQAAHALAIPLVAEGVESMSQLLYLRRAGYQRAQGFFVGLPSPQWPQDGPAALRTTRTDLAAVHSASCVASADAD